VNIGKHFILALTLFISIVQVFRYLFG
jgi:hypothetical protein